MCRPRNWSASSPSWARSSTTVGVTNSVTRPGGDAPLLAASAGLDHLGQLRFELLALGQQRLDLALELVGLGPQRVGEGPDAMLELAHPAVGAMPGGRLDAPHARRRHRSGR